jgi:H+/Cl- antiporter ClcA
MTENDGSNDPIIVDTGASSSDTSTEKTTVPSSNKEKVWNTSIFPTKVAMSPPVEKDKITPQLFIQTIAALIGITSGLAVAVFKLSIEAVRQFFYNSSIVSSGVLPIYYIPIIGSVGVALLSLTGDFSPGLRGVVKEVDDDSLNVQFENAIKGKKNSFGWLNNTGRAIRKSLAAILTLGTGNSLGPEGPSVEIATAMSRLGMLLWPANWFSNKDSITDYAEGGCGRISRNRLLVACGAAAGVSSGFNAPLSGVFFALEVVQASLQPVNVPSPIETDNDTAGINDVSTDSGLELQQQSLTSIQGSISAILLSSVLAALVARGVLGNELALGLVNYEIRTPLIELPLYILLGVSCGSISVVFTETAKFFKSLFDGNVGPKAVKKTFNAIPAPALPIVGKILYFTRIEYIMLQY